MRRHQSSDRGDSSRASETTSVERADRGRLSILRDPPPFREYTSKEKCRSNSRRERHCPCRHTGRSLPAPSKAPTQRHKGRTGRSLHPRKRPRSATQDAPCTLESAHAVRSARCVLKTRYLLRLSAAVGDGRHAVAQAERARARDAGDEDPDRRTQPSRRRGRCAAPVQAASRRVGARPQAEVCEPCEAWHWRQGGQEEQNSEEALLDVRSMHATVSIISTGSLAARLVST